MGSALYEVVVNRIEDSVAEWSITIIHPDIGDLPTSKTFAFSVLMDPYFKGEYRGNEHLTDAPMAEEVDLHDSLDEEWVRANAAGFIESVERIEASNYPPPSPDDENHEDFWEGDQRPTGLYRLKVTHPGWLKHLRPEMRWDTAAYDMGPAEPWEGSPREPGDRVEVLAESKHDGFHRLKKSNRNRFYFNEHNLQEGWLVPSHGSTHYRAVEALTGDQITAKNVAPLVGQPVYVEFTDRVFDPTPRAELLAGLDDGLVTLYSENDGGCGAAAVGLRSVASIGRAWLVRRKPAD